MLCKGSAKVDRNKGYKLIMLNIIYIYKYE